MTNIETNYSVRNAPEAWGAAAAAAELIATEDTSPLRRKRILPRIPIRDDADLVTSIVGGGILAVIVGWAWFEHETTTLGQSPWIALILGVIVAIGVRLGNGPHHADVRATLSSVIYLLTLLAVAYMVERHSYLSVYGSADSFWAGDMYVLRNRIGQPEIMGFWVLGLIGTIQTSYLLRRR
jgi:hypothetical protein